MNKSRRPITGTASQIILEQLAAKGVKYVFNNSGSREARFLDALHSHPDVNGILALHEGSVASQAGGYSQANLDPGVMVVHLGAGVAQSLGQFINVFEGSLPVVMITFAGDTGSHYDRIGMDFDHSFGPTAISTPFTKSSWTVVEPEGLAQAIDRAFRVATTPPVGPVHLAIYDRLLGPEQIETTIIDGDEHDIRAGHPDEGDLEELERALYEAKKPLIYVGDGAWKSGAQLLIADLAERFGVPVCGDIRGFPIKHPLHCGPGYEAIAPLDTDTLICIGARHLGTGYPENYSPTRFADRVIAIGSDVSHFKNLQDVDLAILSDERRTLEGLLSNTSGIGANRFAKRRDWAREQALAFRTDRLQATKLLENQGSHVRPSMLLNTMDSKLEKLGGAKIMIEQFALPIASLAGQEEPGKNVYMYAAGGSEGYGVGGTIGLKLGSPESRVVGLVGDGSLFYSDSGIWTAAHHRIPVLYVIPNNQSYGVVAGAFGNANENMKSTGEYGGVVLEGIDPAKLSESFGIESTTVNEESRLNDALEHGLKVVDDEQRPFLLDVRLPLGLPQGGRPANHFRFAGS